MAIKKKTRKRWEEEREKGEKKRINSCGILFSVKARELKPTTQ